MRVVALMTCTALACGAAGDGVPSPSDAPDRCMVGVTFDVVPPFAGAETVVQAAATVENSPGIHTFQWEVTLNNVDQPFETDPDGSVVRYMAPVPGNYRTRVRVLDDFSCEDGIANIEVPMQGATETPYRVHVVAPPSADRPPIDKQVPVTSGATDELEDIQLGPAVVANGLVTFEGAPIAAYLKFIPAVGPDAVVETFSNGSGGFLVDVRNEAHDVLVIPNSPLVSPQRVSWSPGQTTLVLQQGVTVTGRVRDAAAADVVGATVQLTVDGIPATVGVTDGAGTFSVFAPAATGKVRFEVTPPATTGLPRLVAETDLYTVGTDMQIAFAAQTIRDLDVTTVQRGAGNPLGNATVMIVGALPGVSGTITSNAITLNATGVVRASAVTAANGDLPALRVPAAELDAVIFPGAAGDHAVTPIDLTASVPTTITAAATVSRPTQLTSSTGTALPGAILDAVPDGALALAGAPTIRRVAGANGNLTIDLAPNARYDLRLSDPNGNRAALAVVEDRTSANLAAVNALSKSTRASGTVIGANPIPGAIVQFLCADCTGIERSRPLAEGVTGIDGRYSLAVPDPN